MSDEILTLPAPEPDARVRYGSEPSQFGDLRLPTGPGPHPLVVVVHGGYYRVRYGVQAIVHVAEALRRAGIATWSVEYRRLGEPGGGWPGTFLDAAAAADFVRDLARDHPLDLDRAVVVGHSAGGHLALWLAGRHRVAAGSPLYSASPFRFRGAVSLAGVTDLRRGYELGLSQGVLGDVMGGLPDEVPDRYDAASPFDLAPLGLPQELLHGTADQAVPYELSERYARKAGERGDSIRFTTLPGADHFAVVDPRSPEWPAVESAVRRMLDGGSAPTLDA